MLRCQLRHKTALEALSAGVDAALRNGVEGSLFLDIRVVDGKDFEWTVFFANAASQMMDAVGLVAYEPDPAGMGYLARKVPPHLELDRVLSRICTALRILP